MNFGIIGAGVIARDFAFAANSDMAAAAGIKITAIAARELVRAEEFAKEFNIEKAYGSYDELMNDPDIDGVYIAVVHNFHTELTIACAKHKKAVICEKPFAINEKTALEALAVVRENNVLFMEAMWTRFLPTVLKAKEWQTSGKIGETQLIDASFSFFSEPNPNSRLYNPDTAGGALLDVGVYGIEFAMDFGGNPKNVVGVAKIGSTGVDEMNAISMNFESGAVASINSGIRTNSVQDARIYGTNGHIHLPHFWGGNKAVLYNGNGEIIEEFKSENNSRGAGFVYQILHFAKLFEAGEKESNIMPPKATLNCAKIFDSLKKQPSFH